MKATAPMCRLSLSALAAPMQCACRLCAITRFEDAQHHIEHWPVALHEVTKPLGNRQHPLAHRQAGEYVVVQVRCCLHHAPRGARGADSPAFAGEGYKVVVPTVAAASAGKAMGKDAALKILGKRFAHEGLGGVVVALAVELTRAGQL